MKIFMIICNPKEHSSKEEFVRTYIEEVQKKGHEVRTVNVYDLKIDFLRFDKEKNDFDFSMSEEFKQQQENLIWSNQVVFVYPIWCLAVPPILSTFISKIFAEGIAAEMTDKGPKPLMKDKTAVIIQSYDMPYWCMKYLYADVPMKWWKVVLTEWCGPKIIKRFDFDMIGSASEKKKQKWIKDIKKFVAKL